MRRHDLTKTSEELRMLSTVTLHCRVTKIDIWDTDYNSDNWEPEFMTICMTWLLRVTLDSIRNSCDVFTMCNEIRELNSRELQNQKTFLWDIRCLTFCIISCRLYLCILFLYLCNCVFVFSCHWLTRERVPSNSLCCFGKANCHHHHHQMSIWMQTPTSAVFGRITRKYTTQIHDTNTQIRKDDR